MKVHELLAVLQNQPLDADVFIWFDGNRTSAIDVDTSFVEECNFVEINTREDT